MEFEEDTYSSCKREVKEETGMEISNLSLRAILKTILASDNYAWLLFVYTAETDSEDFIQCPEGELQWFDLDSIDSLPFPGFLREILPYVFNKECFLEGSIHYDEQWNILHKKLHIQETPLFSSSAQSR